MLFAFPEFRIMNKSFNWAGYKAFRNIGNSFAFIAPIGYNIIMLIGIEFIFYIFTLAETEISVLHFSEAFPGRVNSFIRTFSFTNAAVTTFICNF